MDDAVRDAINKQINHEFQAAYLYLAMSGHFMVESLEGFGKWMRMQAREELGHGMRLFDYMVRRGVEVTRAPVAGPQAKFGSPIAIFRQALDHERKVTELINSLYEVATTKKDYPTQLELQWFIDEQVEEEASLGSVVEQLEMVGDNRAALLMMDERLGGRATTE